MIIASLDSAEAVGWISLVIGILVLGAGVYVGLNVSLHTAPDEAKKKLVEASAELAKAKEHLAAANVQGLATGQAQVSTASAEAATDSAKSALDQAAGIIASLPENLRFAGLLILVGTILIGVATVQFGGTSLF